MLGLGMPGGPEWMAIIFVVLLLFGAKKLPELARGLGKSIGEFKKAKDDFATEIDKAAQIEDQKGPETARAIGAVSRQSPDSKSA